MPPPIDDVIPVGADLIFNYVRCFVKRPLRFYDIAAGRSFMTSEYDVIAVQTPRGPIALAVARSPYTGNECYSFAPKRTEIKSARLDAYL